MGWLKLACMSQNVVVRQCCRMHFLIKLKCNTRKRIVQMREPIQNSRSSGRSDLFANKYMSIDKNLDIFPRMSTAWRGAHFVCLGKYKGAMATHIGNWNTVHPLGSYQRLLETVSNIQYFLMLHHVLHAIWMHKELYLSISISVFLKMQFIMNHFNY